MRAALCIGLLVTSCWHGALPQEPVRRPPAPGHVARGDAADIAQRLADELTSPGNTFEQYIDRGIVLIDLTVDRVRVVCRPDVSSETVLWRRLLSSPDRQPIRCYVGASQDLRCLQRGGAADEILTFRFLNTHQNRWRLLEVGIGVPVAGPNAAFVSTRVAHEGNVCRWSYP